MPDKLRSWQSAVDKEMSDPEWQRRWDAPPDNYGPAIKPGIKIMVPVGWVVEWFKKLTNKEKK